MYGRYGAKEPELLRVRLKEIEEGQYKDGWLKLLKAGVKELEKMYAEREREKD
jgi:hypothetical protein